MKTRNIFFAGLVSVAAFLSSCSDFQEINEDPNLAGEDKVKPRWFLNASIMGDQMNPEIAERISILYWDRASRFNRGSGFTTGTDNDDCSTIYLSNDYAVGWLNQVTKAIQLGEQTVVNGEADIYPYYKNVIQMSRIWRVYLNSEIADGPGPILALAVFSGVPAEYDSVEAIYQSILRELREAESALDPSLDISATANEDAFHAGNVTEWKKCANFLHVRLTMRISAVDPVLTRTEFEDVAFKTFISEPTDIVSVQEKEGWDELTSVMSRPWNGQVMSVMSKNLVVGLGGQGFPSPNSLKSHSKNPYDYQGLYLSQHFPLTVNDPCIGFYFDGISQYIDPRALKLFSVAGWDDGAVYSDYIGAASKVKLVHSKNPADNTQNILTIDLRYAWGTWVVGEWDVKAGPVSELTGKNYNYPSISKQYRMSTDKRVFFGPWESYFLLAEVAVKGWKVSGTAKSNYEPGVTASFEYHGLLSQTGDYLSSQKYDRVGTSVALDHTTEAGSYTIRYMDPYMKEVKSRTYEYPHNLIYRNGAYNNDAFTKVITQRYIAQAPRLPEETWSDHRRLGLPLFENQAVGKDRNPLNQVPLTVATFKEYRWDFYPKRYRYPASTQTNSQAGHA